MENATNVLKYMTNGVSLHDRDGNILYINPVFCDFFKVTNEDVLTKKINDDIFIDRVRMKSNLDYINDNINNIHDKILNITIHGKNRWVRVNSTLIQNGNKYYMVTYDDVSDNYNLSYLYEHIFNKMSTGVIFINSVDGEEFIMKDMNPTACRINHIDDKSTIINKSLDYIGTPIVNGVALYDTIKQLWVDGKSVVIKKCECNFRGIITWRNYDLVKVDTGEIVIIFEDITEDVKQKEKLKQADKYKSQFLSNMSHEIRNPINTIVGFSGMLSDTKNDDNKMEEYIDIINSNSMSLMKIIDDVLDYSKIEAGKLNIKKKIFNVNSVLDELYLTHKNKVNKSVILKKNTPYNELKIENDEYRFRQVFNNLLGNAIKFTRNGKIEFGYSILGNYIEFYVKDTGVGINKNEQVLLFNRFSQSHNNKSHSGHGLGLSISKELVSLMGGDINVISEIDHGSTFYFTLKNTKEDNKTHKYESLVNVGNINFSEKTILIVEDIEFNIKLLVSYLENTNVNLIIAVDGNDALIKYNENKDIIDLILMDIQLPGIHGTEVTKIIRTIDTTTPIIAQTAYAINDEIDNIMISGFTDLIKKPTRKDELLGMINNYI